LEQRPHAAADWKRRYALELRPQFVDYLALIRKL
jgi:hypothetical protein